MGTLSIVLVIALKDLRVALRRPTLLVAGIAFSLLAAAMASSLALVGLVEAIGVPLALIAVFNSIFVSGMTFLLEEEKGLLDHYHLYRIGPYSLFLSKAILTLIIIEALNASALLVARIAVGSVIDEMAAPMLALGVYLAASSSISSLISVYLEARSTLLPAMVAVLSMPAAMTATRPTGGLDPGEKTLILILTGIAYTIITMILASRLLGPRSTE